MDVYVQYPTTERGFQEIQIELSKRAAEMNDAAAEVASASVSSPQRVAQASNRSESFNSLQMQVILNHLRLSIAVVRHNFK